MRAKAREKGKMGHDVRTRVSRPGGSMCLGRVTGVAWAVVDGSSCPHRPYALLVVSSFTFPIMRSGLAQRAPSPTNTAFSGISSYRTDSYKPFRDKSSISSPPVDSYQVARAHYDELSKYLASYLAKGAYLLSLHPVAHHPSSLQNLQIPAQQHGRNSRG